MHDSISGGRAGTDRVLLSLVVSAVLLTLPLPLAASESCAMLGGTCRDACGGNEQAEAGAFEDCGGAQECCVARSDNPIRCCIASLDAKDYGPANCGAPVNGACPRGSGSPVPCIKLRMCETAK